MATSGYMANRRSYLSGAARPQALLFADGPGTLSNGSYIPSGDEWEDFIILTDGNRQEISISQQRIEARQRMVNGNMRSYWTADKLNLSTSWNRIPSRAYSDSVNFGIDGNITTSANDYTMYTVDGGAGGVDILTWYENHPGPFWVFIAYDKFRVNGLENYDRLNGYNQVLKMYFSAFDYSVEKRAGSWSGNQTATGFDFWNISISLEEV